MGTKLLLPTEEDHDDILNTAKDLSTAVVESYKSLKDQLCGNVDALAKIWTSMLPSERRDLLSAVWPDVPVHRR